MIDHEFVSEAVIAKGSILTDDDSDYGFGKQQLFSFFVTIML